MIQVDESLKSYIETNILPFYDDFPTALLANFAPIINHIGSTAIPGIMAKRIVDIPVEISTAYDLGATKES